MLLLPSDEEIETLHQKHAPSKSAFRDVYTHCRIVCEIAEQLIAKRDDPTMDERLVRAGALLHDIGVYKLYTPDGSIDKENYIRHGLLGYELLKQEGLDESLCRFAAHHTGVGLTKQDIAAQGLPLPPRDFLAGSNEEMLVMYADKFHSKTNPPCFNTADHYKQTVSKFGADKAARFETLIDEFGLPDLKSLSAKYGHAVR